MRRRKDGILLDVAINVAPMRRADGRVIGFSAVFRDITERKRVEKHLRVVMRELSHRTKNLLAVIVAMVRQTARTSTDVAVLQSQLIQRLQSLSASHDLLVAEDWTGASLEELIRAVLQPFTGTSAKALAMPRANPCSSMRPRRRTSAWPCTSWPPTQQSTARYRRVGRLHVTWAMEHETGAS